MHVQPSQAISIVRDQTDATGLPAANTHTATLWKNGATTAVSVTITNPSTGSYKFAWTIPADASENDVFSLRVVDGDGYASTVWEGVVGVTAELDSAVGTQIDNIENASGYLLAVLAGECADPQTASETYAITVFGSTFTVDMAGQTSTGTRTAPTLTKT